MTDFGAGNGRQPHYDDGWTGRPPARRTSAPRPDAHDRPTAAVGAQRPAARQRFSGVLTGDTGPVPHISGPLPDLPWWPQQGNEYGTEPSRAPQARHRGAGDDPHGEPTRATPTPLPPRPSGAWSRLQQDGADARGTGGARRPRPGSAGADHGADDADHERTDVHAFDADWDDRTGGLEVIGAHVDEGRPRPWRRGRRVAEPQHHDDRRDARDHDDHGHDDHAYDEHGYDGSGYDGPGYDDHGYDDAGDADLHEELVDAGAEPLADEDIPLKPYDPRRVRRRRRRRRIAGVVALVVLAAVVLGIVFGGSKLLGVINPSARDYTGQGYGSVNIRVHDGDTLSDIARTLVDADVLAGTSHFVSAAEANPAATGIAPGVYAMKLHMSGTSALNRLLDPSSRLLARVTIPEGLTVVTTLKRLAAQTHIPLTDLQAAAQNPAALGLPAYANGSLEGFLFPATYDFEPHTTAADMLKAMVTRAVQALDKLNIPADQRLQVMTKAGIVQAEAGDVEDMGKIARVIDNRLAGNVPLQLDTTVNYATGKNGVTTTAADRANPSPYNTYLHPGLPPGPISNPGEEALKAVLAPTPGPWLFFVVVNPDTGETRFAVTPQEHQQNVALFQQWLRAHPNG